MLDVPTLSFVGTVERIDDASRVGLHGRAAVVRVTRALRSPSIVGDLVGSAIVAVLADTPPADVAAGRSYAFEAVGLSYGAEFVVRVLAVGNEGDADSITQSDSNLVALVRSASSIVVGAMVDIGEPTPRRRITEHDPLLAAATLSIESVVKGSPMQVADITIPTSDDVLWQRSRLLALGESGVFFLRRTGRGRSTRPVFLVEDVAPIASLAVVREIVASETIPQPRDGASEN